MSLCSFSFGHCMDYCLSCELHLLIVTLGIIKVFLQVVYLIFYFCYTLSFLYICICKSEFKTYSFFSAYFNKYVLIYCSVKWIPYLFSLRDIVNIENGLCKKEIGDTKGTIVNRKSKKCRCNWSNERGQQENNGAHHTTWALIMCYALFMCITMNIQNTALSWQFQNQRAKSQKDAKLTHLTQIHDRSLSWLCTDISIISGGLN